MVTIALRKTDIISGIILGIIIAIFSFAVLKNLEYVIPLPNFILKSLWSILVVIPVLIFSLIIITYNLGRRWPTFYQFGKFIIIGFSNTAIDFGVLNFLMYVSSIDRGILFSVFKGISFLLAVTNSYFWNKYWTFEKNRTDQWGREFFKFAAVSGSAFLINVGIASFIVNFLKPLAGISPTLWANFGAFVSLVFTIMWTFLGYKFIVFK
ncbi:MAG: GtrA family protein [Thermodesulfobacteriota bacterium]